MNNVIETRQFEFSYGKRNVLEHISIDIHENQMIGLIGRNGSGKTTFMKLCAGLLQPQYGEITVLGQKPYNNLMVLSETIYSYTKVPHRPSLSVGQIIKDFTMFYEHFDQVFAYKLLDFFNLDRRLKYTNLSQGMTSVVSFICALSTRAKLTLLDEPVVGMDISIRRSIYEILLRDYMENPRTIMISSHILSELQELLSEMILLDKGKILLYKPMDDLQVMAYRVEGHKGAVNTFIVGRPVIFIEHKITGSSAIIEAPLDEEAEKECEALKLILSRVDAEELYLCKTNNGKERDYECLWENQN